MSAGECPTCHLMFASDVSFDRHRVGSYSADTKRCLTVEEMRAGLPARGIGKRHGSWIEPRLTPWHQNARGHWTHRPAGRAFPVKPIPAESAAQGPPAPRRTKARPGLLAAIGGA